jgi:crotonobetainyl-CoA:carnitine CoA-transferase CaiB-like acyl-CoA transferase
MKVLDRVRVVALSRVLAGPHCGQLLADFGADVIKVEGPGGDENRGWPPHGPDGQSANFASVNRGKRSLVLDLTTPAARNVLLRLAAGAAGGPPIRCGVSFIDMSTGISLHAGIVTAAWMQAAVLPVPQGSGSGHMVPYQAFRCLDGFMLAGAPNDGA